MKKMLSLPTMNCKLVSNVSVLVSSDLYSWPPRLIKMYKMFAVSINNMLSTKDLLKMLTALSLFFHSCL